MGLLDWAKDNRMMAQGLLGALPILTAKTQKQYDAAMQRANSGLLGMQSVEEKDATEDEKAQKRELYEKLLASGADPQTIIREMGMLDPDAAVSAMPELINKPDITGAQKDYLLAQKQGFKGSFLDYQTALAKAKSTTITNNVGGDFKIPANFMSNPSFDKNQPVTTSNSPVMPIPNAPADPNVQDRKLQTEMNLKNDQVGDALQTYKTIFNKYGTKLIPSAEKAELKTAYKDLQLELKELFNLGVLNGPDLELIEEYVTDPTSISGNIAEYFGGKDVFNAQLNLAEAKLNAARERARKLTAKNEVTEKPKIGQVVDGYKYKGGDPSNPKNWVKQ